MTYNTKLSTELIRVVPGIKNEWQFEFPRLDDRSDDMLNTAIEEFESGNLKNAETDFRLLIEGFPEFLDAYHHLALLLDETEGYIEAKELLSTAVKIGKNSFPKSFKIGRHRLPWGILENRQFLRPYHAWALKLLECKDTIVALEAFKDILSMNPNDNQGVRSLTIDCFFRLAQPAEVLSICKRFPNDTMEEVLYGRPLALFQLGKKEEARVALLRAIELSPHIAKELSRKIHRAPANLSSKYVTAGGADQSFLYWKHQGQHWKNTDGALEFLSSIGT
jgi:tetratricopeptide (TPR) repeat protein